VDGTSLQQSALPWSSAAAAPATAVPVPVPVQYVAVAPVATQAAVPVQYAAVAPVATSAAEPVASGAVLPLVAATMSRAGGVGGGFFQHPLQKQVAAPASNTDAVALAAAKALGGGGSGGTGGLNVVSSNPLSISNPIDLQGGNYNQVQYGTAECSTVTHCGRNAQIAIA
jgi:hypothetical protein